MKDYEKIAEACEIFTSYAHCNTGDWNLQAEHDDLYFNFGVQPPEMSLADKNRLDELMVFWEEDQWRMPLSC